MQYGFGIDVGGTTVKLGFFDRSGSLLEKWEIATHTENGGAAILPEIAEAVKSCMAQHGTAPQDVMGIGIGVPGPVDADGNVNCCVNLGWGVFNLHQALGALTGLPVKAGNDANVAALGEYWKGGGAGSRSLLLVTLGTGIGGGIVLDGEILNGAHGVGGEVGHITVNREETRFCTCGKRGCAEQYASARGIVRLAKEYLSSSETPSRMRAYPALSAKDVFACAAQGDEPARAVLERVYDYLGAALADACCVCDPELVILGGGVSKAGQPLLEGVQRHFVQYMFHACKGTRFALATLGNDAGIYGCFRLVLDCFGAARETAR
jgi:glucokinase